MTAHTQDPSVITTPLPRLMSENVWAEPPTNDWHTTYRVVLVVMGFSGFCWCYRALDGYVYERLVPTTWELFIFLLALGSTLLGIFTLAWMVNLWWTWNRYEDSYVYWLYRDTGQIPYLEPAVYAGETVNPTRRVKGHRKDGHVHHRKVDWAKGANMRIIRATHPGKRMRIEERAKTFGSFWAKRHNQFWGGAEGFYDPARMKPQDWFWLAVWWWGSICFPRHYSPGRPRR